MEGAPPIGRTLLGGLLGTLALTAFLYGAAPPLLGGPMDVARMLAALFDTTWETGILIHFVDGAILFPAVFAALVYPLLRGAPWLRGVGFGVLLWIGAEVVFAPLVGGGLFHAHAGGLPAAALSLAGHLVYGGVLGAVAGPSEVFEPQREASRRAARREQEAARHVEGHREPHPQRG